MEDSWKKVKLDLYVEAADKVLGKPEEPAIVGAPLILNDHNQCWMSPFHSMADRLLMARGALDFRNRVIENLREQIKTLTIATTINKQPGWLISGTKSQIIVLNKEAVRQQIIAQKNCFGDDEDDYTATAINVEFEIPATSKVDPCKTA